MQRRALINEEKDMKEVEQNNINTVLDKIKEDCKAKVKLEADKYD